MQMAIPKEKLDQLEKTLREDKKRIEEKLKVLQDMDFGDSPGLDNEEADETEEMANKLGTIETLKDRLDNIDAALQRMADGKYGLCTNCGQEMEVEILEASPEGALGRECKK
jgi:DnaK suppressor protein